MINKQTYIIYNKTNRTTLRQMFQLSANRTSHSLLCTCKANNLLKNIYTLYIITNADVQIFFELYYDHLDTIDINMKNLHGEWR